MDLVELIRKNGIKITLLHDDIFRINCVAVDLFY